MKISEQIEKHEKLLQEEVDRTKKFYRQSEQDWYYQRLLKAEAKLKDFQEKKLFAEYIAELIKGDS